MAILPISPNLRPQALRPQLFPILQRTNAGERLLVAVRKLDNTRFNVNVTPLPESADDGAIQIAEFVSKLESGKLDPSSVYPRLSAAELSVVPEIERKLKIKGIKVS